MSASATPSSCFAVHSMCSKCGIKFIYIKTVSELVGWEVSKIRTNWAPWSYLHISKLENTYCKHTFLGRRQALLQSDGNTGFDKLTGWMQVTALMYIL
jgi:hypothetical protein